MFLHLLLAHAFAAEPTEPTVTTETAGFAEGTETATTVAVGRAARVRPPYETRSRSWFGGIVPSLTLMGELYDGAVYVDPVIGGDVNFRLGTPSGLVQPELRLLLEVSPGVWSGSAGIGAVLGARFGRDRGWYGGVGAGVGTVSTWVVAQGWLGYAFRIGDFGRVSPELSLGTMNTITCRFEWSVAAPKY